MNFSHVIFMECNVMLKLKDYHLNMKRSILSSSIRLIAYFKSLLVAHDFCMYSDVTCLLELNPPWRPLCL